MLMPSGSAINLPVCLTISPKRMQVPRAGWTKKKIFFPEEPASKHFRLSWPYGLCWRLLDAAVVVWEQP